MGIEIGTDMGIRIGLVFGIGPGKRIRIWMRVGMRILILDWKLWTEIGNFLKKFTH